MTTDETLGKLIKNIETREEYPDTNVLLSEEMLLLIASAKSLRIAREGLEKMGDVTSAMKYPGRNSSYTDHELRGLARATLKKIDEVMGRNG